MNVVKSIAAALAAVVLSSVIVATPVASASAAAGVTVSATADGRIKVSWGARSGAGTYEVRTSSAQDLSANVKKYKTKKTTITVRPAKGAGVASGNYTFVNVFVHGRGINGYPYPRAALDPVKPSSSAQQVTVATFNVRTAESDEPGHSWKKRLPVIATQINASGAGIISLQEAGANLGKVINGPYDYTIDWQFNQVVAAVDPKYQLVYADEYSMEYEGGKEGTRILYDSTRFSIVDSGFFAPSAVNATMRWVPWVLLSDITTGTQVYFIAVHLENGKDAGSSRSLYNLRMKQIGTVIAKTKEFGASGTQVIIAGDLNSNIYSLPKNGVHQKLIAAGFYDAFAAMDVTNGYYDTFNFFGKSLAGASRTDYILTYGPLKGAFSYEHVINKRGTVASDHDLQIATVPY